MDEISQEIRNLWDDMQREEIVTEEQLPGCWVATTKNYDGPGSPIGMGFSREAAIADLILDIEMRNDK